LLSVLLYRASAAHTLRAFFCILLVQNLVGDMSEKILVAGATGNAGGEVLRQLTALGVPVRALVRNRAKAEALAGPNVELVEGDLAKPDTLPPALEGVGKALLSSAPDPNQAALQNNLIDAAVRAGLRHIVKISAIGAAPDSPVSFCRWHAETERRLIRSGVPYTILQPNFFMQNTFSLAATIAAGGKFYGSMKDGKASFVDLRDIAAVATAALTTPGHEGKTYVVTGPEALSFAEVAAKLSAALGRPVAYVDIPRDALIQAMTGAGLPVWQAQGIAELYDWGSQGGAAVITDVIEKIAGKKPIVFDEFARDFAPAFQSKAAGS
jgi:uncharacterized protein YbjT (DUF2867 family)